MAADLAADAAQIAEYAAVAVRDYGTAVLAEDPGADREARADSSARLGRTLLMAIFGTAAPGDPLPEPLATLAADPDGRPAADPVGNLAVDPEDGLAADPGDGLAADPDGRPVAVPGPGPAVAALAGYVQRQLGARPELAGRVGGMLPHCGLTLVMSRQRRAAGAPGAAGAGSDGP